MKQTINFTRRTAAILAVLIMTLMSGAAAFAQTTAFTYQGRFTDVTVGQPTGGTYTMTFRLFDAATGGNQIPDSSTAVTSMVSVTGGIFTTRLDFGAAAFSTADARYLEIQIGSTVLTPRQEITSTPFAMRSVNAATADRLSANCIGCVTNANINAVDGAKIAGTVASATTAENVTGIVAVANGGTGSQTKNFVDLTTAQTIGGDKTFSNTVSGNVVNATQFNIGGNRVLGASTGNASNLAVGFNTGSANTGYYNVFAGNVAGYENTSGNSNSFVGFGAGNSNSTGNSNSFFGTRAGNSNQTGGSNSFFGAAAGYNSMGGGNSFFGASAGATNQTGSNNTALGSGADVVLNNLTYATAVGAGAKVGASNSLVLGRSNDTVNVPGDLTVSGTLNASLGQDAATVYGTSGLTVTRTNPNFVLVPGLTQTIDVPANTVPRIVIATDGGIRSNSTTSDGRSVVEVAIYVDGALISSRQHHLSNASISPSVENWALSCSQLLTSGSHTIEVRARSTSESFLSNATVSGGGAGDNVLRGQLTVTTIKR